MEVVYAQEPTPLLTKKSIFLVGPTPRRQGVESWRPAMIDELRDAGFDGFVFSPEPRGGNWQGNYDSQVEWEKKHLELCDLIIAWVARKLPDMPAFTTNVEFGRWVGSQKLLYGRPMWAEKTRYLDWMYRDVTGEIPYIEMVDIAAEAVRRLKV